MTTPSELPPPATQTPSTESGAAAPFTPVPPAAAAASSPLDVARKAHSIPALDGVRAIAASLVFLVHFQAAFGYLLGDPTSVAGRAGRYLADAGYNGVNIFFGLSGYLIYGSLIGRPTPFARFFVRRVRRIYPTYWVVLASYVLVALFLREHNKLPGDGLFTYLLENVLLVPGVFPIKPIVTVSWSLSYEIFFYLGLALAVSLLALRRWPAALRAAALSACIVVWIAASPSLRVLAGSFIMFVPGMLLYEAIARRKDALRLPVLAEACVGALIVLAILWAPLISRGGADVQLGQQRLLSVSSQTAAFVLLAGGTALLIFAAVSTRGIVAGALSLRPVRTVGIVSYSFYLLHGATINVLAFAFGRLTHGMGLGTAWYLGLLVPVYLACVGTALLLFWAVERRFSL